MAIRKLFEKLAEAVKWEHIDDDAVRANNIQNLSITEPKFADGAVSERVLADESVSSSKLAPSAVGSTQLANGSVTRVKLAGDAAAKESVGLGNVDNTSDEDKPISAATQAALNSKEPLLPAGGDLSRYMRGDKTFVRLDTLAVWANTNIAAGNLNSVTAPGVYSYQTATNLPSGAGAVGTLIVTPITAQQRNQLVADATGNAWLRGFDGTTWTAWRSLSVAGTPHFWGRVSSQTHTANSEERLNYATISNNVITNASGELALARAGKYRVTAFTTGPWKSDATGFGRTLRIQHNGATVGEAFTDVPVVWGSGVGAFQLATQAFIIAAAGDKVEGRMFHATNVSILASHRISVEWVE